MQFVKKIKYYKSNLIFIVLIVILLVVLSVFKNLDVTFEPEYNKFKEKCFIVIINKKGLQALNSLDSLVMLLQQFDDKL